VNARGSFAPTPIVAIVLAGLVGLFAIALAWACDPRTGETGFILPTIFVNTTIDEDASNLTCSLREAIKASNMNQNYNGCTSTSYSNLLQIGFNLGTGNPVINVAGSPLPAFIEHVTISGSTGNGRVVLNGPCNSTCVRDDGFPGLSVQSTAGIVIRNLVINDFPGAGIKLGSSSNVSIFGNFIGTTPAGDGALGNQSGVELGPGENVQIGGPNGVTLGGGCTGECNLISGNVEAGIYDGFASQLRIRGNFIGTDVSGQSALGNPIGISGLSADPIWGPDIGGLLPEERNVISGNPVAVLFYFSDHAALRGNYIGTNSAGTEAVEGSGPVIVQGAFLTTIGIGAGNVIAGSSGAGIELQGARETAIWSNLIGLAADGTTPLPNASDGVRVDANTSGTYIGDTDPGTGNEIAFNSGHGVGLHLDTTRAEVRGNSIHDNLGEGIGKLGLGFLQPRPVITAAGSASGTACSNCAIDIFSDSADEGAIYEGSTMSDATGNWFYPNVVTGPNITATMTAPNGSTSRFSLPFALPTTPTPSPSPSPTASPSATSTSTPTSAPTGTPTSTPTSIPTGTPTAPPTQTPTPSATATAPPDGELMGDANCDGVIDTKDVMAALSDRAGVPPGSCGEPANTDCDGDIDAADALRILLYLAGIPDDPPGLCPQVGELIT
jgi:CSLREA domain-containing protein